MSDSIQVAIRLRPLNEREIKSEKSIVWKTPDQKTIFTIDNKATDQKYLFDRVYDHDESTYDIYEETVKDIVLAGIEGFNGTIFAYGQTSSGKTFTMSGTKFQMGIIPLAIQSIFTKIDSSPDREFLLRVSYMEIYNEKITDLLDPDEKTMKMLEDENRQIIVSGLHEEVFRCVADVINLKKKGDARRRVGETARNEESSRSHAIFQIIIESQERQFSEEELIDESVRVSSLYFVDLAGSEKASENTGERFREGCAINKSLMTLAQVISKLSDGVSNQYINYRDSKLTRLLQNGLGGNSKTAIICTINPTAIDETSSTLRFASRAKIIKNKPTINELTDTSDKAILKRYQREITDLQQQLETFKKQTPQKTLNPYLPSLHEQEKAELEKKYQSVISKLKSMICVSTTSPKKKKIVRRETWCPGVLKRKLEQAGHLPALTVIGTPSRILGNILEETHSPESGENIAQSKAPMIYVNSACQTEKMAESEQVRLLKFEIELIRNKTTMMSAELNDLKERPAKQRRVSFKNHDETMEFLELELQFSQEKNSEEEKRLEMERRKLKVAQIKHDEAVRVFQAEKKQLMQRVEATEGENSCLLTNLGHSQERMKNLENELTYLQNKFSTTTGANNRHSMDRPLLNLSNITERSKRSSSYAASDDLKEQVFNLQSEMQMQETEIQKLSKDLEKCKEQLKNKFEEIRFLSLETTEQKDKLEILQQENEKLTRILEDKTPILELPEVIELNNRLSEVSQEKNSLQQKLKSKAEELTYLSRQSAVYLEQIESKNTCLSAENRSISEVETFKTKLDAMEAEKSQALRDLNINKLYCDNIKDQLKMKTDECLLLQKNLNATHEEVVAMRNTLVEIKEQLLAKEELILELSHIKPSDMSSQQSVLFSPDQEANDSLQDQFNVKSKECENSTEYQQDLEEKNAFKSQDEMNICAEDQNGKQDGQLVQQEKVALEEKYNQLMEEHNGLELLLHQQGKELSAIKQSLSEKEKCLEEVELELKAQLDAVRETYKIKEEECICLSEQLAQTRQEYDDLAVTANSNEEKPVVLKAEVKSQLEELGKLQQQLLFAEQNHEKKVKECLDLNEQVSSLNKKLLQNSEKQHQLEKELETQSQKCSEVTKSLKLSQKLEPSKNEDEENSNSEDEILFQTPASVADITLLDSLREELDAKREECDRLKEIADIQECEVLKEELKTLKIENENMILACDSMKKNITELKEAKKCKEELMDSLRNEFEKKSQDYQIVIDEMKTVKIENENKLQACISLSEKVSTLKQEKAASEEMLESLREEFNAKEEELGCLKKELEDFKRNSNLKCNECEKLAEELSAIKVKIAQYNKMSLYLEEVKVKDPAASEVETTVEIHDKDATHKSDEKEALDLLKEELRSKSEECTHLSAQLQMMTEKNMLESLTTATHNNNKELSHSKHQLEDKINECHQLQEELANIRDDYHVLKMSLEELQDSSQLCDSSLQNQLSECQTELESKRQECTSLGKKLSEMQVIICNKTEECTTLNEKISTLEERLHSKTEECQSLNERFETLNATPTAKTSLLQQVLPSIEEANSDQQHTLDTKDHRSEDVYKELEQLYEQYNMKTSECKKLSNQMSELKKNYEHIESSLLAEEMLKKSSLLKELEMAKSNLTLLQEELNQQSQSNPNFFVGPPMLTDDDKQTLAAELESKTQKCSMLFEEMDNLKTELENLKSQKEKEAQTMRHSFEELEAKSLDYDILVEEIKRSNLNSIDHQSENKDMHEEIVKKTNELEEMKVENARLTSSIEQEQQNLAVARSEIAENLSELESMRQECSALKEDLTEMNSKTNSLQESLRCAQEQEQLTAKNLNAKSFECEQLTEGLSNVKKECESLKLSLLNLDEENNRLSSIQKDLHATQSNLDTKITECTDLSQHVEALNAEVESLKISLLNLNDENQQLLASKEKMVSLQAELDTKFQDNARLLEEVSDLKNQKHVEDLIAVKETTISAVQKELESKLADLAELKEQYTHLTKKISEVEIENVSLRESLIKLDEQNDKLSTLNVINEKELVSKSEICASLSAELEIAKTSKSTTLAEVESKLESKSQEYLKLMEVMSALKKQASSVEERFSQELESKCEEYALLLSELTNEKQNKMKMLEEMEMQLSVKTDECISLSKQIVNLKKDHEDTVTCFEKTLAEKSQQCDTLSTQLADLLQKHSDLEILLNGKELSSQETVKIEEKIKFLVEEYGSLKEKLQAEEEKVKTLMSQLEAQNKLLEYKEEISKFLYESNASIKSEMDQLKDQIASQSINNSSLQKSETSITLMNPTEELTQTTKTQDSNKSVIKKLKQEIIELKDKLEDFEGKAGLCEVLQEEIKSHLSKIEIISSENTMKSQIIAKLKMQDPSLDNESFSKLENQLQEKIKECRDLSEQLKNVQSDLMEAKAQIKKIKVEKIELSEKVEVLEGKADLCELYEKENKEQEFKLKELEEEKLETTLRVTKLEAKLEKKPEVGMMSINYTEDVTELSQQLKTALEEKDSHKSVAKKLKIEKIQLKETLEDLEGKANLCEILQEEIKNHVKKLETLHSQITEKDEIINNLKIDVREKQECIHMLETRTFCDLKAQELESLQRQLSKKSMHLVWAQSDYKVEKAQFEKKMRSYEETIDILTEKIKYLKEELRLLQAEKDETVKIPRHERKRTRSATQENVALQSQGFIDHMAFITLEAENSKLNRKIESLKQKLSNSLRNHEELKKELHTFKETAEKENTPSKRKKVAEKSTNTEIFKLSESTPTKGKLIDKNSPSRLKHKASPRQPKSQQKVSDEKDECRNQ